MLENPNIEGNPFIIRFKTSCGKFGNSLIIDIEGNPFIIRFKTKAFDKSYKETIRY